jgi:DNA-directed RNA polymerase subunit RPC12/RpoP
MKCKRCGADMVRRKLRESAYQYRCPKCGFTIGTKEDSYREAYTQAMDRAAAEK